MTSARIQALIGAVVLLVCSDTYLRSIYWRNKAVNLEHDQVAYFKESSLLISFRFPDPSSVGQEESGLSVHHIARQGDIVQPRLRISKRSVSSILRIGLVYDTEDDMSVRSSSHIDVKIVGCCITENDDILKRRESEARI